MSHVTVYKIESDGDAKPHTRVPNGMAGASFIWNRLSESNGFGPFNLMGAPGAGCALWDACASPLLSMEDSIVLGFTLDGSWVKRENMTRLIEALQGFWERFGSGVYPTIPGIIKALQGLSEDPSCRGVCFQQTSVSDTAWSLPVEDADPHVFNFDRDKVTNYGKPPWELFAELDPCFAKNGITPDFQPVRA